MRSGLRVVYAYFPIDPGEDRQPNAISMTEKIVLIEIYHKNDKDKEDKKKIYNNFD